MPPSKKTKSGRPRPDGELRRGQMITTYGPGSLVDLVHDAVLIPGLEYWHYTGAADYAVAEPRLAANLRRRGLRLSTKLPFRSPPVLADDEPHRGCGIGAVEFPNWFVCPKKNCDQLVHKRDTDLKGNRRVHRCRAGDTLSHLVPVRFVTACTHGHLSDFPWEFFAHPNGRCSAPSLRLIDSGSGDISDVWVVCDGCDTGRRSMSDARGEHALPRCQGWRPWLSGYARDESVQQECDRRQRLLLRTASNSYFSQVESALSIPQISNVPAAVREFIEANQAELSTIESEADLPGARKYVHAIKHAPPHIAQYSDAQLWLHLKTYRAESADDDASAHVRETEYATIVKAHHESLGSAQQEYGVQTDYYAARPAVGTCPLPDGIGDLVLLKRLREVRVTTGFTRLESQSQNIYGEFDLESQRAELSAASDWLPASEIRGEGIFLSLDTTRLVDDWEQRPAVVQRAKVLRQGFEQRFPRRKDQNIHFPGIRFYLLHTLAHLLITQISLECGYAASAIRERIYCSPEGDSRDFPMAGLLLSTGSSGSEGTLGGLVEEGRRIEHHLTEALRRAKLCSHDPVCARQEPASGAPGRHLLGAACHGCLFIAECSCERSNHYLDRGLVVPLLGHNDAQQLAFFVAPEA